MKIKRLKHLCQDAGQYGYNWPASDYVPEGEGLRLLRTTDLKPGGLLPASEGIFVPLPVPEEFLLRPNDILLSRSGTVGRSYLVPDDAAGSTFAGFLVRFRPRPDVDARYVAYALSSTPVQGQIQAEAITSTIQNFNAERYANLSIWTPRLDEQRRIADFLDEQVSLIDRAVELRRRQHDLLLASLHSAASHLLHSPCADGETLVPLRRVVSRIKTGTTPAADQQWVWGEEAESGATPWLSPQCISEWDMTVGTASKYVRRGAAHLLPAFPARSTVVVGIGSVGRVAYLEEPATGNQQLTCIEPSASVTPRFLTWSLWARQQMMQLTAPYTTMPILNNEFLLSVPVTLPSHKVQKEIVDVLDARMLEVVRARRSLERWNSLAVERRSELITAVVTGHFDVTTARAVA